MKQELKIQWDAFLSETNTLRRVEAVEVDANNRKKDEEINLKMYDEFDRDRFRIVIDHGILMRIDKNNMINPCDTSKMSSHAKPGLAAFTINLNGEISIFQHNSKADLVAHSSLNQSRTLLYAGEIKIEDGKITAITDHSGHYRPEAKNIYALLKNLRQQGVDISNIVIDRYAEIPALKPHNHNPEIKRKLNYRDVGHLYNAGDFYEYMEKLENKVKNDRAKNMAAKIKLGFMFDELEKQYPDIRNYFVQATQQLPAEILLKKARMERGNNFVVYIGSDDRFHVSYYNDAKAIEDQGFLASEMEEMVRVIELLKNQSERISNMQDHIGNSLLAIFKKHGVPVCNENFNISREEAEKMLVNNPEKVVIRASSKGDGYYSLSYMDGGKFKHGLSEYHVDRKFSQVRVKESDINTIKKKFSHQWKPSLFVKSPKLSESRKHGGSALMGNTPKLGSKPGKK